jgi:dihydrofolate reductase
MRLAIYGAACSLDGFIARKDGAVDWLFFSKDVSAFMAAFWKRVDTVLMGRKTWEVTAAMGQAGGGMGGMSTYVFSRTLTAAPHPAVRLVTSDAGAFVRELKSQPGKDICVMGGGDFARSLFEAGVIDEVGLNIHPVLLGSGIPLFVDPGHQTDLALTDCRVMQGDCVLALYRVRQKAKKRAPGSHTPT